MCSIEVSPQAKKELKKLGCDKHRFLRLCVRKRRKNPDYLAFVDSTLRESDEILIDSGECRVVSDVNNVPMLDGVKVDFGSSFVFNR